MKKLVFLSILLFSGFGLCELVDRTMAIVGKELILKSDVDDLLKQPALSEPTRKQALDALIDKALLLSECKKFDLYPSEDEVKQQISDIKKQNKLDDNGLSMALIKMGTTLGEYKKQLFFELCKTRIVQTKIRNRISITKDDVVRAYNRKHDVNNETKLHLRALLIEAKSQSSTDKEKAKKLTQNIASKLKNNESWEKIKEQFKNDAPSVESMDLGVVSKSDMLPEIANVVYAQTDEKIRGPIETENGFQLFEVLESVQEAKKPLVDEEKDLHKQLFEREVERLLKQFVEEARSSTYVDIMESA